MNRQQVNLNQYSFTKYIKINEHFFTYYNNDPLKKNHYNECLFKGTSITIRSILLFFLLTFLFAKDNEGFKYTFNSMCFYYIISIIIGKLICECWKSKKSLRIDIIYSFNFDKIFIGTSYNDAKEYWKTFELFINEIDRFILKKNRINEIGFHLCVISKGNTSRELCYIEDRQEELEGLIYILNGKKLVGSDFNIEQQRLSECPPPLATSGY